MLSYTYIQQTSLVVAQVLSYTYIQAHARKYYILYIHMRGRHIKAMEAGSFLQFKV